MATMRATINTIQNSNGKGPHILHTSKGLIKCWDEQVGNFSEGESYEFPYYNKPYQGLDEIIVGKGIVKKLAHGSGVDYQAPPAPSQASVASNGVGRATNTPMSVANAPQANRERSIQAQAIIKAVIAVGGNESDVQRWLDAHDKIVAGERIG